MSQHAAANPGHSPSASLAIGIHKTEPHIARFTDTGHHIIEEAAFSGIFGEKEISQIEAGNISRDYSQLPRIGNAILLCDPRKFGGYEPKEHFDNFIWNKEKKDWENRDLAANQRAGLVRPGLRGSTPIDYITSEMTAFANEGLNKTGLARLGNAFHTIEDFFAHSNFIELINEGSPADKDLLSGSVPGSGTVSIAHVLQDVSPRESGPHYQKIIEESRKQEPATSHANIAKDHPSDKGYKQARQLAALVIRNLSLDLKRIGELKIISERMTTLESTVFGKIRRWLRPPDAKNPWWTELIAEDNGQIDRLLEEAERKTPATVNQCILSPLRNLEASKDSPMKIVLGAAIPVEVLGSRGFLQVGGGLVTPLNIDDATITTNRNEKPSFFFGGQLTIPLGK